MEDQNIITQIEIQEQKELKKMSLKQKLSDKYSAINSKIPEFQILSVQNYVKQFPPFDENKNRQGKWLQKPYEFNVWYKDIKGRDYFISPAFEMDEVGVLYDENSQLVLFHDKQFYEEIILLTSNNEYFIYRWSSFQKQSLKNI